jgi:membrane associated rhomboid family serine protease
LVPGSSVWTKIIRNKTAVQYLFNGESYDFNYQFENRLPKPIQLFPVGFISILFSVFYHYDLFHRVMNLLHDVCIVQQTKL